MMTKWIKLLLAVSLVIMTSGCTATRSVVSLDQPTSAISNPEQGIAVKIIKVSDDRHFEASPKNPDTPSLRGDDVSDPSLTARAIGRKRNGYGMAWGDIMLPENQTVADMMKTTITNGFRNANYRVLAPGEDGYDAAIPVQARVVQFWSWIQMGFWQLTVHNRTEVELSGAVPPLQNGLTVRGSVTEKTMAVTDTDWKNTTSNGLKVFSENLVRALAGKPQVTTEVKPADQ